MADTSNELNGDHPDKGPDRGPVDAVGKSASSHERNNAEPDRESLTEPKEVWKNSEVTPADPGGRTSGGDRVADAGDVGGGNPSPYSTDTQADEVSGQTKDRSRSIKSAEKRPQKRD